MAAGTGPMGGGPDEGAELGPAAKKAIADAAHKVWRIREEAKDLKKQLKLREDEAVLDLCEVLEKYRQEACKAGPFLITVEAKTKIRVQKKAEKRPERIRPATEN